MITKQKLALTCIFFNSSTSNYFYSNREMKERYTRIAEIFQNLRGDGFRK